MSISFYLRNLAGSCLQLFPVALLLFFPYGKENFRFHPLFLHLLFAMLGIASAVYPFFAPDSIFNFYLNTVLLFLILAFYVLVRDNFTRKSMTLFVAVFCLKIQAVFFLGYYGVRDFLEGDTLDLDIVFNGDIVLISFLTAAVLVPVVAVFERRVLKPYLRLAPRYIMWLELLLLVINNVVFFFLAIFCVGVFISFTHDTKAIPPWFVLPILSLFVAALTALYYIIFRITLVRTLEVENKLQMELLRENSASLQREIGHFREVYHDLRQLLRQLNAMSGRSGFSDLKPYIEKIVSLTEHVDTIFCENNCLNTVFQYYVGYANEKDISMKISAVCGDISIKDADLTLLIANALENAISGVQEYRNLTGKASDITVTLGIIQHRLLIQVTNNCAAVKYSPNVADNEKHMLLPANAFDSTHENGGYGLKRIDMIANQYQGTARFQFNEADSLWTTRIAIPVRGKLRTGHGRKGETSS